jgi:GNAT superfamily N-acetyltransferase
MLTTLLRRCRRRPAPGVFGVPQPETFWADRDYVNSRWRADHTAAFCAEVAGEFVGSNFATRWGSVGFFGPITVGPDSWDHGVAKRLMGAVVEQFDEWGIKHAGCFTFAQSAKHVGLYQKFGFWPRYLTAIMASPARHRGELAGSTQYSDLPATQQQEALQACRKLTDSIYEGLDLGAEIRAVQEHTLGDTILAWNDSQLQAFAVCHYGPRSEAGAGMCFVKFGAVQPGKDAEGNLGRLLDACEALALKNGVPNVLVGVNLCRNEAYRYLIDRGFRTELQGVTMHRPNQDGYSRPGIYVLDDWR